MITTLQYDIQSEKRKIEIQKSQSTFVLCVCVYVCEGFCITPTSSYAMLKLHNLFSNQMKWKKIERYTQRKVWHTINLSFSLCLHNHEIIITSHSSEHFATFSSPYCYILLPPQVWDGSVVTVRSSTTPWCQDVNHVTSPRSTAGRELSSHELGHFDFVTVFVVCVLFMN